MNPTTIGAFISFLAGVLLYTMLITAKGKTGKWRWTIWMAAAIFLLAGCTFLLARKLHYPAIYGEWVFDGATLTMLLGVTIDYLFNISIPPATTAGELAEMMALKKRALNSLLVGVGVALLIVLSYAWAQPSEGQPVQTADLKEQASITRAHIDEGFACLNARLDTMTKNQQADHALLMESYERGLVNRERIIKTESALSQIASWFKRWGRQTQDAIERTRKSITTPSPIRAEPTDQIPVDRVKKVPPKQFDRKGKPVGFNYPDTTSTRVAHHQR